MMTREAIVSATPALLGRDMDGAVAAVTRYRYHIQEIAQVVSGWLNVGCVTVRKLLRDTQFVTQLEPRRRSVVSPSPLAGSLLRPGCLGAGVRFPSEINSSPSSPSHSLNISHHLWAALKTPRGEHVP